ncbi:MAG: DcaP family trimeric outer membrane transporter [Proteobacteria bacterium]|nr:DcaP family trimeric outer membrane transporter [Pseudomonadota bacterium]
MMTRGLRSTTVLLGLGLACFSTSSPAHGPEHEALEARVARLEALVAELTRTGTPDAGPEEPPAARPAHSYEFGGYIKFDSLFSDYGGGDLSPGSPGSQFYIPATIPVGGVAEDGPGADIQGRESRLNFRSDHTLANGDRLSTFLETDFLVGPGGNERVSNSFTPRLRHAFFRYNDWLFGQTWSTFQDQTVLPENLDFIGPVEGTTFVRQAQVRYTKGPWEFALENPETTITPFGGGPTVTTDDGSLPDLVGRYSLNLADGHVRAAVLFRELAAAGPAIGVDDTETAFGFSLSGKHRFGDDDIRWMATVGRGTGRYLGLNTANDAVIDAGGRIRPVEQWGAFVSLRHFWNPKWRSNFTLGYLENDHDTALTGPGVTRDVYSVHANLLYEPAERMTVGGEVMYAERTLESRQSGDLFRTILSAKYAF